MHTVVCFGDSNTWGCPPFVHVSQQPERLPMAARWTHIMAAAVGHTHVVEEGLGGRTTVFDDPIEGAHKNGTRTLIAALESHAPLDVFIFMLGANDFKVQFNTTAYNSARGVLTLVQMIKGHYALADACPEILIVTPPAITELAEPAFWDGAHRRCEGHAYYLAQVADRTGCFHFDANRVTTAGQDGVHIDADGHRALGLALGAEVKAILAMRGAR
jgi:lysophospholipase L1-like esterase